MSLNSSGVWSRPSVVIGSVSCVPGGDGSRAESARGIRRVLLAHRGGDVAHREAELRHLVRIELEQHREVARRERRRVADARARASARPRRRASCSSRDTSRRSADRFDWSATTARMSVFALRIVMPFVRTASGSCGSASFTAFCTSTAARSWLRDDVERHVDRRRAVARVRRRVVEHPLQTGELLLDRRGDGLRGVLRRRARDSSPEMRTAGGVICG